MKTNSYHIDKHLESILNPCKLRIKGNTASGIPSSKAEVHKALEILRDNIKVSYYYVIAFYDWKVQLL